MKTLLEKLFVQFDFISMPASNWFSSTEKKVQIKKSKPVLSPECFNVRGMSIKKEAHPRRNPMP